MKVSVIIPAYNEKDNLKELFVHIDRFYRKRDPKSWEFIIVDDGSTDGSYEVLKELAKIYNYVKIIRHRKNFGLTDALITGSRYATGEAVVFFPADLQFHLEDVERMAKKMQEGYDLVAGKKIGKYEKKFVSSVYNWVSQKLFNIPVSDMNSIKIMKKEIMELIPRRKGWHRYIIPIAAEYGYAMTEIPVSLFPRLHGQSKFKGLWRIVVGVMDLIAVKLQLSFTRSPMLFLGVLSFISFGLGILTFLIALVLRLMHHGYRPLLYLVILFILAAIMLFTMGYLAELIANFRDRPVDEDRHKVKEVF